MNLFIKPNFRPGAEKGPEELDTLLRSFFRAEMPHPWPAPPMPETARPDANLWVRSRSRLALAASVALLILGSWWLAGRTPDFSAPIVGAGLEKSTGTADMGERDKIRNQVKEIEKRQ